jgi:hypothetical protein
MTREVLYCQQKGSNIDHVFQSDKFRKLRDHPSRSIVPTYLREYIEHVRSNWHIFAGLNRLVLLG